MSAPIGNMLAVADFFSRLFNWVSKKQDVKASKRKFFRAIRDECRLYAESVDALVSINEMTLFMLDKLNENADKDLINQIVLSSATFIKRYADLINSYVSLSFAIKEYSVNEDLMTKLQEYDGFLYDFVCRISDTVIDYKYVKVGREYFRFLKSDEDKSFADITQKDIDEGVNEMKRYVEIIKKKLVPALKLMSIRRMYRKKRIKREFKRNNDYLRKMKKKFSSDIPEKDIRKILPSKFLSLVIFAEELDQLETQVPKSRRLR